MIAKKYIDAIDGVTQKEFGAAPDGVTRLANGVCNEVYHVAVAGREVVIRLNGEPRFMLGSSEHIPLFRSKGIIVPEIVAEDLSRSQFPVAYQILTKIEGRDIKDVIETLSDEQLRVAGGEIANIFRTLSSVPNNGKFGVRWGDDKNLVDSWSSEVERVTRVVIGWGKSTGVLDDELEQTLTSINREYKDYFDSVRPYTYFGDIAAKNVMIHEGRFAGLVDLDSLAQGDPLEAVGRIKASWYGTRYGKVYTDAIMDALSLKPEQRKIVTMYALLNRSFATLENGVRFNQNSSTRVDQARMKDDKAVVRALRDELNGSAKPPAEPPAKAPRKRVPKPPLREPAEQAPEVIVEAPLETPAAVTQPVISLAADDVRPSEPAVVETSRPAPVQQPTPQKVMLEASGLSKTYISDGMGFDALKNVDLRIHQGDCIAIVGKSGSGKSTLMHLLACLDNPSEGYVYVDGEETTTMSEPEKNRLRNEKFGFVFQQFFLNGRDTVFENVVLPLRIRGSSDFDMATEAQEALDAVGLSEKTDKRSKDLSGGEKQRVCIARALVSKPQVIFADEPTGNLDSNTGAAVENMLFGLNREKGITLVIVTHDPDLAKRCSRIVEMKDGKIIAEHSGDGGSI